MTNEQRQGIATLWQELRVAGLSPRLAASRILYAFGINAASCLSSVPQGSWATRWELLEDGDVTLADVIAEELHDVALPSLG